MERTPGRRAAIEKALDLLPAPDAAQAARLESMGNVELGGVVVILGHGLADTVEGAIAELHERLAAKAANKEAARRRAGFSVLEGGR